MKVTSERPQPLDVSVSMRMARQARKNTDPELRLRRRLHAAGARYRIHYPVPGRPRRSIDVAFTRVRLAVFLDGCFWHGCPLHRTSPRSNADWWSRKIAANRARDEDTDRHLRELGWTVQRAWEHDDPDDLAAQVLESLDRLWARLP